MQTGRVQQQLRPTCRLEECSNSCGPHADWKSTATAEAHMQTGTVQQQLRPTCRLEEYSNS